ncbi:SDR family NAD(P)-dependent oxidoreductase [Leisingera sp. SS27]|uniref:SDR family oxidoreductase n=1 Tax=Leisingera sp. SS27 TaxID=2979462 RepID=UPI00232CE234|nr:SDR family oxidoreductase [Leisingera sp. SS27]MDC0660563.1 SDR family NAD(P)-dependent oxidoreductase [Leisingera sp. SS27]
MKVAIVTGAGSGIGRATSRKLLDAGYQVALFGRRQGPLEETAAGHKAALVLPTDVSDENAVEKSFMAVSEMFGHLDLLFNNAGAFAPGNTIDEIPYSDWKTTVAVNLNGAFLCARAAFKLMRHQTPQGGRIINNGSISSHSPRPGSAHYTSTKHAITGLTKSVSLDGRRFNIACGQIDIGNAATDMTAAIAEGVPQADMTLKAEPVMDVAHVADAIVNMASLPPEANVQFMTIMATTMPFVGRG